MPAGECPLPAISSRLAQVEPAENAFFTLQCEGSTDRLPPMAKCEIGQLIMQRPNCGLCGIGDTMPEKPAINGEMPSVTARPHQRRRVQYS